ncbi:MAG: hypothetical protein QOE79_631 [Sphingomonadales bacterium]|jgi:hypothetical protein|nr:hypothetical protein [Sphingomonadales bacterium]
MRSWCIWAGLALLSGGLAPAAAQAPPSPTATDVPDLAVPGGHYGDARKYFLLHKPGVTVEQAEADLSFCWRFLARGVGRSSPGFIPWGKTDAPHPAPVVANSYGLIGMGIAAIIDGPIDRSLRQSRIFRCMVPRGYDRYRTSEDIWKMLNSSDAARSIHLQALIAAGPPPPTPIIRP